MSRVAELLSELVAIPTHQAGPDGKGGNERRLCEHLAPLLRERGADEVVVADATRTDGLAGAYVFARWGTPRRIVNAHIDTVPANAGWSRDPWQPHITGGKLYGLGSADTKGAIAATLVALDAQRPTNAGVLFSGDEEHGSAVMHEFLASPHVKGIKEAIVCEPTARTAGIAHRGVVGQIARVEGEGGHSSKADFMPKPIAKLARLAVKIEELGRKRLHDGPSGMTGVCMNIAAIHGGVAFNVIPQRGALEWSLRPYPGFDRGMWDGDVAAAITDIEAEDWDARGRPASADYAPRDLIGLTTPVDHEPFACDALAGAVRPFVSKVGSLDFWTEAALYQAHGIDAVVIGPGDIGHAHAADEYVTLDDLDWAVDLYRSLLASS